MERARHCKTPHLVLVQVRVTGHDARMSHHSTLNVIRCQCGSTEFCYTPNVHDAGWVCTDCVEPAPGDPAGRSMTLDVSRIQHKVEILLEFLGEHDLATVPNTLEQRSDVVGEVVRRCHRADTYTQGAILRWLLCELHGQHLAAATVTASALATVEADTLAELTAWHRAGELLIQAGHVWTLERLRKAAERIADKPRARAVAAPAPVVMKPCAGCDAMTSHDHGSGDDELYSLCKACEEGLKAACEAAVETLVSKMPRTRGEA